MWSLMERSDAQLLPASSPLAAAFLLDQPGRRVGEDVAEEAFNAVRLEAPVYEERVGVRDDDALKEVRAAR